MVFPCMSSKVFIESECDIDHIYMLYLLYDFWGGYSDGMSGQKFVDTDHICMFFLLYEFRGGYSDGLNSQNTLNTGHICMVYPLNKL